MIEIYIRVTNTELAHMRRGTLGELTKKIKVNRTFKTMEEGQNFCKTQLDLLCIPIENTLGIEISKLRIERNRIACIRTNSEVDYERSAIGRQLVVSCDLARARLIQEIDKHIELLCGSGSGETK